MKSSPWSLVAVGVMIAAMALGAVKSAPTPGDAPAELRQKLEASRARWAEAKARAGGNYEYVSRFVSFTGFGWECTVVIRGGKVAERRYRTSQRAQPGPAPADTSWVERGEELGTHPEGVPPRTLDELYDEAARLLDQPAKALKPRWVYRENDAGLLLACGWVDEMIMDDAPFRGVRIDEIRMGAPPAGSTKN